MDLFSLNEDLLRGLLFHTHTMLDVLTLALSCKKMYQRLAYCLPTAIPSHVVEPERSNLYLERILAVVVGSQYLQKLQLSTQHCIPHEFFSIGHCRMLNETRLAYLIRNYYQFISPEIGLIPLAIETQLLATHPNLIRDLLNLPQPVMAALLQSEETNELVLRLALAQQISLFIDYRSSKDPNLLLMSQRRHVAQQENSLHQELHRLEKGLSGMEISFARGDKLTRKLPIKQPHTVDVVDNRFLRMLLSSPGRTESKSVTFAFDPVSNQWRNAHVITRNRNSFLPDTRLNASFLSVSS
jgi:hypothetical protein